MWLQSCLFIGQCRPRDKQSWSTLLPLGWWRTCWQIATSWHDDITKITHWDTLTYNLKLWNGYINQVCVFVCLAFIVLWVNAGPYCTWATNDVHPCRCMTGLSSASTVTGRVLTGGAACSRVADHQRMSSHRQIMETLAASSLVYCPLSTGPGYWYLLS